MTKRTTPFYIGRLFTSREESEKWTERTMRKLAKSHPGVLFVIDEVWTGRYGKPNLLHTTIKEDHK